MSISRLAPLVGLIALTLTGCGEDKGRTQDSAAATGAAQVRLEIERVWNDVYDASRAGDGKRVCSHATPRYARRLVAAAGGDTCAAAARNAGRIVKDAVPVGAAPKYSSFSTSGDRATIRVTLPAQDGPLRNTVRFRLVDGEWRVDGDSGVDAT
jgi:hypothetical protein